MRVVGTIVLAILSNWLFSQSAIAEKRVALTIGNSAYQNVSRLANPGNDSEAMSATLKNAGFDVVDLKLDINANAMRRALRDFSRNVRDADIAIVYYAGHGIEIDGTNYVIPVDAVLERDIDAFDEAIPLDRILTVIEPAKQLRLIILDACRDNPFNQTMKRTIRSRAGKSHRGSSCRSRTHQEGRGSKVAEAERAKTAALAKAAEDVKAAAQARAAADLAKKAEEAKMAESEGAKAAAMAIEVEARTATDAKAKDDKAVGPVAALQPPEQTLPAVAKPDQPLLADIPRLLQIELRRVGCNTGSVDGNWNAAAQRSLDLFNKYAGMKLDVKVASLDALDAVKGKSTRICPLICEHGFKADGGQCLTISCRSGFRINDNNECERIQVRKLKASREEERTQRDRPEAPSKPTGDRSAPASASDARSRDALEHEATIRAEALYAKCKQQFGVNPRTLQAKTSNAGMAACIRNGGMAN
jgi:Caspase domain